MCNSSMPCSLPNIDEIARDFRAFSLYYDRGTDCGFCRIVQGHRKVLELALAEVGERRYPVVIGFGSHG